jgi:hypothetical protein
MNESDEQRAAWANAIMEEAHRNLQEGEVARRRMEAEPPLRRSYEDGRWQRPRSPEPKPRRRADELADAERTAVEAAAWTAHIDARIALALAAPQADLFEALQTASSLLVTLVDKVRDIEILAARQETEICALRERQAVLGVERSIDLPRWPSRSPVVDGDTPASDAPPVPIRKH